MPDKELAIWDGTLQATHKFIAPIIQIEGTAGSVLFHDGTKIAEDNSNLFWDDANKRLEPNLIKITSDGTQAAPALKFNDTNTGFFKSGDSLRFSLNNSTIMIFDSTGLDMNTHNITASGASFSSGAITADGDTLSGALIQNIVIGTGSTPPTASNFTRGTIYIQYTV